MSATEKRILIVDDDEAIRALLFAILRYRGFAVDCATNGVEALSRLRSCRYDAMLLDLMMPLKSGYDVLDDLKKVPPGARPIIFVLTAGHETRALNPALVTSCIRKPFDVRILLDMIMACFEPDHVAPAAAA